MPPDRMVRNGTLVIPGNGTLGADIAVEQGESLAERTGRYQPRFPR